MLSTICLLAAAALVAAQQPASTTASGGFTLPWGLDGKVERITGIASQACSNKYINNTEDAFTVDDIICDKDRVPQQFQDYIPGLKFGPDSVICGGYACALRFLGCVDATYRIEAKIIGATGKAESCSERVGLNASTCATIGKFITQVPLVARKRDVAAVEDVEMAPFTEAELEAEVAALKRAPATREPTADDVHLAKLLIRSYFPKEAAAVNNMGLAAHETLEHFMESRKRQGTFQEILKQVQLCNPLISAGVNLVVMQFPALAVINGKFGPCGQFCELAMCGLTLMCHTVSRSALLSLEAQRVGMCNKTSCSKWAPPLNVCNNAPACDNTQGKFAPGTLTFEQCQPPKTIRQAGQLVVSDCCDTCDDVCKSVACRPTPVESCGVPSWPLCKPYKVETENPFQCCPTCVDVCKSNNPALAASQPANCPPPPPSCPTGKVLGAASPSSCCLACVDVCANVQCPNIVTEQDCKNQNKVYLLKTKEQLGNGGNCEDCCPRCVAVGSPNLTEKPVTAASSAVLLSAVAALVAALRVAL